MDTFTYDNPIFEYAGRFNDTGSDIYTGWSGSQVRFKITGTLNLKVYANIVCPAGDEAWTIKGKVDDLATVGGILNQNAIYTGEKDCTFEIPDTGEHEIILCLNGSDHSSEASSFYSDTRKVAFSKIDVDTGGIISPFRQNGDLRVACIGDSWMADALDWIRYLDREVFSIYPISCGGNTSLKLNQHINYAYDGQLQVAAEGNFDLIIMNSAVNDKLGAITDGNYETYMLAAVQKAKVLWPGVPIFLLQSPDFDVTYDYSRYGNECSNIATAESDVYYVPIAGVPALGWTGNAHLNTAGQQTIATFYGDAIKTLLDGGILYSAAAGDRTAYFSSKRLSGTQVATVYNGTTAYSFVLDGGVPVLTPNPSTMGAYVTGE